nr:retrovirus-related Pol polyprotein from transposon TNT 1-94 [Tanacetum cinerariifolium]
METKVAKYYVDKKYFNIEKKELFIENDRLLEYIICQYVMCTAMHADLDNKYVGPANDNHLEYAKMKQSYIYEYNKVLELEAELSKKKETVEKDVYNELLKQSSRLEQHCIILEITVQQMKERMYKLDLEPLYPKVRKNKEAHVDYLKKDKEHADTLCDVIEQARAQQPLDNALEYACKFTTRTQELLVYVSATFPSSLHVNEKLVAITPMNKSKKVRFKEPKKSTSNTPTQTDSQNSKITNQPLLPSAGVKWSSKSNKNKDWKPTSNVFPNVRYRWIPTGRTFTIDGNKFPLNRITSTTIVPPKKPFPTKVVNKTPPSSKNPRKPNAKNVGSSSKSKSVESKISNDLEPNKNWGSNVSTSPSTYRVHFRSFESSSEAVAIACYTKNHSLIRKCLNKTPYELLHDKKPDLTYFYVFGALCYPTNDSEDLGKLKPKADIRIFIGYSLVKKAYRIYNKQTRLIMETIYVEFDELTTMASEEFDSGPKLQLMTPRTITSGLAQNPSPSTPYPPSIISLAPSTVVALIPVDTTGIPSSTLVDQDAPSSSTSLTPEDSHKPVLHHDVKGQEPLNAQFNDPFANIFNHEPNYEESTLRVVIESNVHTNHQPFEHLNKWTKNHPLDNVIDNPSRPILTRKQLQTDAMWC